MEIRQPNHAEEAALRRAAHLFDRPNASGKNFWREFRDLGPATHRLRLVAEVNGTVLGHLQGAFANGSGVVEEFSISTDTGRYEVGQALMEIFEVHCITRDCETILAETSLDEQVIKSRGFVFFGSIYLKPLKGTALKALETKEKSPLKAGAGNQSVAYTKKKTASKSRKQAGPREQ
ncbi:MAG TPA: hypothetical protein VMZ27_05550 [Candidatus Saccharimonadales bacterium]|nr:hypothetical protein [Candidatus Saccharimonadales bacterium]